MIIRQMQLYDPKSFPPPLAAALAKLSLVRTKEGVSHSGLEACAAIEAWFTFIGCVLLAEYLDVGAPDVHLNRIAFDLLENRRPRLIGRWVALSRECATVLQPIWSNGRVPTWPHLPQVDFGNPDHAPHPVTRLIAFRNAFSHGSLRQTETAINEHTHLLEQQVTPLALDMAANPLRFVLPSGRRGILRGSGEEETSIAEDPGPPPSNLPPMTPFVEMPSGEGRVLAPALAVARTKTGFEIIAGSLGTTPQSDLVQRFAAALDRHHKEQHGYILFTPEQVPDSWNVEEIYPPIREVFSKDNALILVQYRPGCGQRSMALRLLKSLEAETTVARVWRVIGDHPSSVGVVFGRALLRWAEVALQESERTLELPGSSLEHSLERASERLHRDEKTVGAVLMDAARGFEPCAGKEPSVVDICKVACRQDGGFRIVLLDTPDAAVRLPHDGPVLTLPSPETGEIDQDELHAALTEWKEAHSVTGPPVLEWLLNGGGASPVTLADAVEALSAHARESFFPPAVEHALWTAVPFLERSRDDDGRFTWIPADGLGSAYADSMRRILANWRRQG